jgi:hypothetical protein
VIHSKRISLYPAWGITKSAVEQVAANYGSNGIIRTPGRSDKLLQSENGWPPDILIGCHVLIRFSQKFAKIDLAIRSSQERRPGYTAARSFSSFCKPWRCFSRVYYFNAIQRVKSLIRTIILSFGTVEHLTFGFERSSNGILARKKA